MKSLIIIKIALLAAIGTGTIISNEIGIINYKKAMLKFIRQDILKDKGLKINVSSSNAEIKAYPVCRLAVNYSNPVPTVEFNSVEADTTRGYAIITIDAKTQIIAKSYDSQSYFFYLSGSQFYNGESNQLKMISYAETYSANPFFVYFFPGEGGRNDLMGFFVNGKISFVDEYLHLYKSTADILKARYGSVQKFKELIEYNQQKKEEIIKTQNFENARNIYRNDYKKWWLFHPNDTTKSFDLFIREMDKYLSLTKEQKALLKEKIYATLIYKFSRYNNHICGIPFCGEDITYEVQSILTRTEFEKYNYYRDLQDLITIESFNTIYEHLKKENKVPELKKTELVTEYSIKDALFKEVMQ